MNAEKEKMYQLLIRQQEELLSYEDHWISILANSSALLNETLRNSVFTGYYLFDGEKLFLGPFQGKVSCTSIQLGRGVCGAAAKNKETLIVDDVREYDNYISCDSAAASEIVVPMCSDDKLLGVLDIDSSKVKEYDDLDKKYLENYIEIIIRGYE
ncbi:GAF domain-containing protein [Blautia liquoris]|jgi:GAF domain-containing protein|uniref:GAF domain-containing protein n=1 Tax=Blautia liquoris TaxID=2779518 RepID=A0A7M2RHF9_9FIRM|nr:GAF domain-containing protein [Blautia liquoris]QOV19434.1 GAF domain-containing protein [Blautia liquoris]